MTATLLVGDIGGTNARLALLRGGEVLREERSPCARWRTLAPMLTDFLARGDVRPDAACIAVAGPVRGGRVPMTNLGWVLETEVVARAAGCPLRLVNDFHAQAIAMPRLTPEEYLTLCPGERDDTAPIAVLGAGTGLGEAIVAPDGRGGWLAVPGEGAHGRFAPRDERDLALLRALWQRWPDHVSVERVVSGPGLVNVYDHLRGDAPRHPEMETEDAAAVVVRRGLAGTCSACVATLEIFAGTYGEEAATLALKCNAGVVYLTGGVTPRVRPVLETHFRPAFVGKGRYGPWLETVPVRLVTHPDPGLMGATVLAEALLSRV